MKTVLIMSMWVLTNSAFAQVDDDFTFKYFLSPRPTTRAPFVTANWDFKPMVQIPALKVVKSKRANAELDASFFTSAGGGISLQRTILKGTNNYTTFSTSLIALVNGDTSKDDPLDLSCALTIGFFDNILQLGIGRDFGSVNGSRWFGLLSAGINLTNN